MTNMFAKAWKIPAKTSTPVITPAQYIPQSVPYGETIKQVVESNQVMGKPVSPALEQATKNLLDAMEVRTLGTPAPIQELELTVTPEPIKETPVAPDMNVVIIAKVIQDNSGNAYLNGEEVSMEEFLADASDSEIEVMAKVAQKITDAKAAVIVEEKFVDIDTHEVVAETKFDFSKVKSIHPFIECVKKVNDTLRDLGNATTEEAYTYGINHLKAMKGDLPDGYLVAHIFGPSYDLWIAEYDEANREFYGFASFGGILDDCAEWGYVSLDEILGLGPIKMERDFYWSPTTLDSLIDHHQSKEDDAEAQLEPVVEDSSDARDDMIETVHCYYYEKTGKDSELNGMWTLAEKSDKINDYHTPLTMDDAHDIYFDTIEQRDTFIKNQLATWYPIRTKLLSVGKNVPITFDSEGTRYGNELQYYAYGARVTSKEWKDGFTVEKMKEFVRNNFKNQMDSSPTKLKDDNGISQSGGAMPLHKPGIGVSYRSDAKHFTVDMHGFQYVEDKEYSLTWKEVHEILHPVEVPQASMEFPADGSAPFNKAEETAKKTPDVSWFDEPGYKKYNVVSRPTDRVNRLVGNMVSEHPEPADLYACYSGKGGLHEINFNECANFNAYTEAKQEFEMGEFYTPDSIAETMVKILRIPATANVVDSTCGMARFFNYIPNEKRLFGYDVNYDTAMVAKKLFPESVALQRDIFYTGLRSSYGIMQYSIGNPPFNISQPGNWAHPLASQNDEEEGGNGRLLSQNAYVFNNTGYLVPGGVAFFIVPATWLNGIRHNKVSAYIDENYHFIAELALDNKAFSEYGVDFGTKALLMIKKGPDITWELPKYEGSFENIKDFLISDQYQAFLKAKYTADHSVALAKLKHIRNNTEENDRKLYVKDKVLKAIYETTRGWDMEDKKSFERRETEMSMYQANLNSYKFDEMMEKQAKRLNKAISRPERTKVLNVEFIISRYDIIIKRSNTTVTEYFNRDENKLTANGNLVWLKNKYSKNDLCTDDSIYLEFKDVIEYLKTNTFQITYYGDTRFITTKIQNGLIKYIDRIREEYRLNSADTGSLKEMFPIEYEENVEKLSEMEFPGDKKLLPHQVEDLAGVLLKRNALISWDTGLGKTLGGITWSMVKGGKTLVIAPAVNTIDPWYQQLTEYHPNATVMLLKKASDIYKYKGEDYLIVSFESLPKIYKTLATFQFRNLILDESDNAKNKTSKRFKSLRAIAKRFKNRLLMSGTPTRNNVNEIYNQIELLCQNSRSMMCWAEEMIEYDRSSREWDTSRNPHYGKPFPAWGGHKAFENTFSPKKLTCFGAAETNQDIFNKDILDSLIRSIRFTRIFDVEKPRINAVLGMDDGDGVYKEYKQVTVPMNKTEEKVYDYILTDLANQMEAFYRAQHDGATASMLVIMQQIMKLMQGTSHPWTFKGYTDDEDVYHEVYDLDHNTSTKLEKACEIIDETFQKEGNNKIMMASPWRETDEQMFTTFTARGYTVFRLTSDMTKHNRAKLVTAFRSYAGNAIICGTMGCLKSGLNLPEVNTVIAESYPWNFAQLHQYAARAIRLNSTEKTDIYCLTSEGSFDVNVFSLILRKEVANTFVRTSQETSMAELSKGFGVESTDLFSQAMQMVKEKTNGRTRGTIKWGTSAKLES